MSDDEEFRPIEGFEDRYEVSNHGRVKSLRYYGHEGREGFLSIRWNQSERNNTPQGQVRLINSEEGKDENRIVSRLVAEAFIPNPEDKEEVNHIDGDTTNNHVDNLEWVTRSENQKHAVENGLADPPPSNKDMGEKYAWEHEDGEYFWGSPAELARSQDHYMDKGYLHKIPKDEHPHHKTYKGWTTIEKPKPGSPEAADMGGSCPRLDNAHGEGSYKGGYIKNGDCPLHGFGREDQDSSSQTE